MFVIISLFVLLILTATAIVLVGIRVSDETRSSLPFIAAVALAALFCVVAVNYAHTLLQMHNQREWLMHPTCESSK